jgi:hypothetical protein
MSPRAPLSANLSKTRGIGQAHAPAQPHLTTFDGQWASGANGPWPCAA